jgi:protein-disulfide isomerase
MLNRVVIASFLFVCNLGAHATVPNQTILEKFHDFYEKVENPTKVESHTVVEFFSYNCNYCYESESLVQYFLDNKSKDLIFTRLHVGSSKYPEWQNSQLAFAALKESGDLNRLHDKLFEHIQTDGGFQDISEIESFFKENQAEKATELLDSAGVRKIQADIKQAMKNYGIRGVPRFIVNGQYKVYWGNNMEVDELYKLLEAVANL